MPCKYIGKQRKAYYVSKGWTKPLWKTKKNKNKRGKQK